MTPRLLAAGRVLSLERPLVMGIVNATPDSFSDEGELMTEDARLARGRALLAAGDRGPSGLRYVEVDWGDGSRTRHRNSSHVYKKGRYTLRVAAVDRADNRTVKTKALRIP